MLRKKEILWMTGFWSVILLMIGIGMLPFLRVRHSFFIGQQNMIGALYEKSPQICEEITADMFAPDFFQKDTGKGRRALTLMGYTEEGMTYLYQNTGWDKFYLGAGSVQIFAAAILVYGMIWRRKQKRQEEDAFIRDIRKAETDRGDFQIAHHTFLRKDVLYEISKILEMLQKKELYLQEKNKDMQAFIENIAHQIKTPLSCISLSLDLMLEDAAGKQKQQLQACFRYLDNVETLIKKLLDIGRMEAGKILMQREAVSVSDLLEACRDSLTEGKERIWICQNQKGSLGETYYGDPHWLREAFLNILHNCLEHDQSGEQVAVQISETAEGVKVIIRDHGTGISNKDLPFIFDRFYVPEGEKFSHTGIGLNLAKLVIEKHFGTFKVRNHEDGGAEFSVVLPIYALKNEKM